MPRIVPGSQIDWLRSAVLAGSDQFVAAERSGRLYRIGISGDRASLELLAENRVAGEFIAGLTSLDQVVYGVLDGSGGPAQVIAIDPDGLTVGEQTPLDNEFAWGPRRVGDAVFVADAAGYVYCFDGTGAQRWKLTEPVGPLAGDPLALNGNYVFASSRGDVWVVDANGRVTGRNKLSEPLGGGPMALGGRLLVTGWDGTLYLVNVPQ